ncbi:MAG: hypothetical protein GX295_01580 [Syntrophomonadaceae bacterium]|nr:hypothetical protein [Syntrophomonadaceae bacterium]
MTYRETDQLVVLGGRESRLQGKGVDRNMQPAKVTLTGQAGPEKLMQTSLQGIAQKAKYKFA